MENHEDIIDIRIKGREEEASDMFKQFDIIPADNNNNNNNNNSISDHHYALLEKETKYSSQTTKIIMREWKILEDSLPDSIYVRAYEGRIDLLRAVIVGASGTPYQDGLFFFDIKLPLDYPSQPPEIHCHSYGFRLNPNLYQCGSVCISLINTTYGGSVDQRWNPSKSTLLQVLVSIQALVLNSKPYFNELPPHINDSNLQAHITRREKISLAYNEETFILSCKKMLAVINKPPRHFESFVAQHFRGRAETILTACKAYIDDVPRVMKVAVVHREQPIQNNSVPSSASPNEPKRYQELMRIIYSRLVKAFIKNGSSYLENRLGSYYMDVDEKSVEPLLRREIESQLHLSEFILPLFVIYIMFGLFPTLIFIARMFE